MDQAHVLAPLLWAPQAEARRPLPAAALKAPNQTPLFGISVGQKVRKRGPLKGVGEGPLPTQPRVGVAFWAPSQPGPCLTVTLSHPHAPSSLSSVVRPLSLL